VRVLISRNLHLPGRGWAVRDAGSRRVIAYAGARPKALKPGVLTLPWVEIVGACCLVNERERAAMVARGVRSVHAYVAGELARSLQAIEDLARAGFGAWRAGRAWDPFTYNPFRGPSFTFGPHGRERPMTAASRALFDGAGAWAEAPC
jgi:hypothetical protein